MEKPKSSESVKAGLQIEGSGKIPGVQKSTEENDMDERVHEQEPTPQPNDRLKETDADEEVHNPAQNEPDEDDYRDSINAKISNSKR